MRVGNVRLPRLDDPVAAAQDHERKELLLKVWPPLSHGVLMWPLAHRLGELPAGLWRL